MHRSRIIAGALVLFAALEATGQDNKAVADSAYVRVSRQSSLFPQEKIHVQTDKGAYLSGERIWLRAHLVNASDGIEEKPSDSIWYSELNSTRPLTSSNYITTSRSDLPALPVIDDVVLPEYDVMTMSPGDIDNIFVIKDYTSQFGYYPGYSGAVVITTSRGEIGTPPKSYNIARVKPLGYQQAAEFWSPVYETRAEKESAVPDLRTTIYWNPEVVVDGNGECALEFWTADKNTEYAIYGEGVSADGSIFTVRRTIKIEDR